jgi:hypothetical protein
MFGWLGELTNSITNAITAGFSQLGTTIANTVFEAMLIWIYTIIWSACAEFFTLMGNMGADIFELIWVENTVLLFNLLGWSLFTVGVIVAVFDLAIEYQNGRGNVRTTMLNILKGFLACSLISTVPIELYKFTISLQNTFANDIAVLVTGKEIVNLAAQASCTLKDTFTAGSTSSVGLFTLVTLIAYIYCVVSIFFQNIKRGGILLIQMSVGSLYMFSVPRGYTDGFILWVKQVIALCLTAFMQTTLLYMGLLTLPSNMLLGLGIMLAAKEVPRIAQQFGMDTSAKFNIMSAVHATTTAINLTRIIAKK